MHVQTPSVGRIVHYTNLGDREGKYPPSVQAAIITGVNDDKSVSLHVFYKTGAFDLASCLNTSAVAGTEEARGCWSWPVVVK
jgi:hypothetical protein